MFCFLSCRPFVVNATFSTGLVRCWSFFCLLADYFNCWISKFHFLLGLGCLYWCSNHWWGEKFVYWVILSFDDIIEQVFGGACVQYFDLFKCVYFSMVVFNVYYGHSFSHFFHFLKVFLQVSIIIICGLSLKTETILEYSIFIWKIVSFVMMIKLQVTRVCRNTTNTQKLGSYDV